MRQVGHCEAGGEAGGTVWDRWDSVRQVGQCEAGGTV